jgi:hypothetical protein
MPSQFAKLNSAPPSMKKAPAVADPKKKWLKRI